MRKIYFPLKNIFSALALALLLNVPGTAQTGTHPETNTQNKSTTASEEKTKKDNANQAEQMLQDVFLDVKTLRNTENRIYVKTTIADLLWDRNQELARSIYIEVMNDFGDTLSKNADDLNESEALNPTPFFNYMETVRKIGTHDAPLAYELLRSTRQSYFPPPDPKRDSQLNDLELNLLKQMANKDPKKLLKIAEEQLKKGISTDLLEILKELRSKDDKLAATLATDLARQLKSSDLVGNRDYFRMVLELLNQSSQSATSVPSANEGQSMTPLQLDDQSKRDLITLVAQQFISTRVEDPFESEFDPFERLKEIRSLLPEISRYAPSQAPQVRSKLAEYEKVFGGIERLMAEAQKKSESATVDSWLQAAEKSKGNDHFIQMAVETAINSGDFNRARQIANEKISDPQTRKPLLDQIDQRSLSQAIEKGKFEEAKSLLATVRSKEGKISTLARMADQALDKKDVKTAIELLNEALALLSQRPENQPQLDAQLELAVVLGKLDPVKGFELVEPLVNQVNDLVTAMATLDGFYYGLKQLKNDEYFIQSYSQSSALVKKVSGGLANLASLDFARARLAADKIQRPELRAMAHLELAQKILRKPDSGCESQQTDESSPSPEKKQPATGTGQ